jgi:hypothetical protein
MNKRILFIGMLVLAALACKATENAPPMAESKSPNLENSAPELEQELSANLQLVSAPEPEREICHVRTKVNSGILNLRSCGGTTCSVISYLSEGEPLTVLEPGAWLKVETVTSEQGYVNSNYCRMENK